MCNYIGQKEGEIETFKSLEVVALKWCKEHVPRDGNDSTEEGQMLLDDPELGGAAVRAEMTGIQTYRGTVVDKENGTYIVVFLNLAVGKYTTVVFLDGHEVGLEKPSNASVIPEPMNSNTSMVRGTKTLAPESIS